MSKYVQVTFSPPPFFCSSVLPLNLSKGWGRCGKCNLEHLSFCISFFRRGGGGSEKKKSDTLGVPQLTFKGRPKKKCKLHFRPPPPAIYRLGGQGCFTKRKVKAETKRTIQKWIKMLYTLHKCLEYLEFPYFICFPVAS